MTRGITRGATRGISRCRAVLLIAIATLAALTLAGCDGNSEASGPTEPAVRSVTTDPAGALPATPGRAAVALDIRDPDEAEDLGRRLVAAGFALDAGAPNRVRDAPAETDDQAREFRLASYAYVVHPRAPLLDLTPQAAASVVALEAGAGLGGPLIVVRDDPARFDQAARSTGRLVEVGTPDAVIEAVLADPTSIGRIPLDALEPRVRALTIGGVDPYWAPSERVPGVSRWVSGPDTAAVAEALGWPVETASDPALLLATGELIPARCVSDRVAGVEGGYGATYDGTRDLLRAADLAISHWEPAVVEGAPTPCTPTFNLSTSPEAARAAAEAGVDVALAVGNHMGDCWPGCGYEAAVLETVGHIREAGIEVAGAGADLDEARAPVVREAGGVTFAILAYDDIAFQHYGATEGTAGTAHAELADLAADVRAAAARADHVVVGFSWGIEYTAEPTARQRDLAHAAIDAGASLVVGNHPHWVQATEWYGDGFIAYGLGNFVFDQDWSVETTQGAILEAGFTRDRLLGVRLRPTAVRQQYAVELLDPAGAEGSSILHRIWDASDAIAAGAAD